MLAQDRSVYLQFSANLGALEAARAASPATALAGASNRQLVDEVRRGASHNLIYHMAVVPGSTKSEAPLKPNL